MRDITHIVIHHSVTPRDLDLQKSISSFNRTHTSRFKDMSTSLDKKVAYHYVISGDGNFELTREYKDIGYHASNWEINKHSIGICLSGNFDNEKPSKNQIDILKKLIKEIKLKYDVLVIGHRDIQGVSKSCPGNNFTIEMIKDFNKVENEFSKSQEWALKNKYCNDKNWDKPLNKAEYILTQYRINGKNNI